MRVGKNIAVYWQSWSSQWVATAANMDLASLNYRVNIVNLAFANPQGSYVKGSKSFSNTGLDFSMEFGVVAGAIKILQARGVTVMLAVGGASYMFDSTKSVQPVVDLAGDLGVDGIDLDWEPANGAEKDGEFTTLIRNYKKALPATSKLSAACFSTGAYGKNGDQYQGMNIRGLVEAGSLLDWVNIMAYDAGPPPPNGSFDPLGALTAYRLYYPGPLMLGFEPGQMGWGGHFIQEKEIVANIEYVAKENPLNGIFIWSYQKDTTGSPSVFKIIETASSILQPTTNVPTVPTVPTVPVVVGDSQSSGAKLPLKFECPACKLLIGLGL